MVAVVSIAAIVVFTRSVSVVGAGMEPTLREKDRLEVAFGGTHAIKRFDLVEVTPPATLAFQGGKAIVLRVVGMPGDKVAVQGGPHPVVFVKQAGSHRIVRVESSTWASRVGSATGSCCDPQGRASDERAWATVPADAYWLLGDNWGNAIDGRTVGFLRGSSIASRLSFRVLPVGSIGSVGNPARLVSLDSAS